MSRVPNVGWSNPGLRRFKPEEYDPKAIASIPNLYKNRMDDLDELEAVGQARDEEEEAELDF